jgi:hypothetical protein
MDLAAGGHDRQDADPRFGWGALRPSGMRALMGPDRIAWL